MHMLTQDAIACDLSPVICDVCVVLGVYPRYFRVLDFLDLVKHPANYTDPLIRWFEFPGAMAADFRTRFVRTQPTHPTHPMAHTLIYTSTHLHTYTLTHLHTYTAKYAKKQMTLASL